MSKEKTVILLRYIRETRKYDNFEKVTNYSVKEVTQKIVDNNANTDSKYIYRLIKDAPIEDITKALCHVPKTTRVDDLKEELCNKLDEVTTEIDALRGWVDAIEEAIKEGDN